MRNKKMKRCYYSKNIQSNPISDILPSWLFSSVSTPWAFILKDAVAGFWVATRSISDETHNFTVSSLNPCVRYKSSIIQNQKCSVHRVHQKLSIKEMLQLIFLASMYFQFICNLELISRNFKLRNVTNRFSMWGISHTCWIIWCLFV